MILSDDLEMGGILKFLPVDEAAVEAIRAGSDLVEICHSAELILRTYDALLTAAEKSASFRTLLLQRAQESARKRARLYIGKIPPALSARQFEKLRSDVARFRDTVSGSAAQPDTVAPRTIAPAETS